MDTISASEASRRLRTSLPRVRRAIDRLGLEVDKRPGGRVLLSEPQLELLRSELGVVPPVDGLSRIETQVLAALARAPRGLAAVRAVARRAGVSPTAATGALRTLAERGLVRREREWVAAGRAREVELVRANVTAPEWASLAPHLAAARLPNGREQRRPSRVPARLRHVFWNAGPSRLELDAHGAYIAERLLSSHDLDGLAWGAHALTDRDWEQAARNRGLSAAERALARNLAESTRAGLSRPEHRREPTTLDDGLQVAGLGDLLAMKLNAIAGRAQLRDYFDLMTIERQGGRTIEEGLALFLARYQPEHQDSAIASILLALGYLDDVGDDLFLPVKRDEIVRYWQQRQPELVAAVERYGISKPA